MGRPKLKIDPQVVLALRSQGKSIDEISREVGVSTATLSRRITEIQDEQGILTKYRQLQGLHLTKLRFKILEAITTDKIQEASALELIKCYEILQKAELAIQGKESYKTKGLVGYLMEIEKKNNSN
jgi:DNA-binding Lrp family transcriptional regulator